MGASLYVRPIKKGIYLPCNTPSTFIQALHKAFHDLPLNLDENDIETLKGMAAMADTAMEETINELIDLIEKFKSITLTAEY